MKKLLIILTITTFFACDSKDDDKELNSYVNTSIGFSVFNTEGEDLLDPETPNHIDTSKMKLFYVVNGVPQEFYQANLDNPRNIVVYKKEEKQSTNAYSIGVIMNDSEQTGKSITYIQWNEKDTDTIEATYARGKTYIYPKDVWFNGKLVSGDTKFKESTYVRLIK